MLIHTKLSITMARAIFRASWCLGPWSVNCRNGFLKSDPWGGPLKWCVSDTVGGTKNPETPSDSCSPSPTIWEVFLLVSFVRITAAESDEDPTPDDVDLCSPAARVLNQAFWKGPWIYIFWVFLIHVRDQQILSTLFSAEINHASCMLMVRARHQSGRLKHCVCSLGAFIIRIDWYKILSQSK